MLSIASFYWAVNHQTAEVGSVSAHLAGFLGVKFLNQVRNQSVFALYMSKMIHINELLYSATIFLLYTYIKIQFVLNHV